ncbi:glycosyltransferase [Bacillus sp. BP-3]|uniref:glycosyltransferase n=1 Tax=Bacillus sp. BP-3 TaxID=3022773 RepID=UPI00232FF1FB|nr:glycosyltransferase [Bacillus sp. BP-3]MDC2866200.1 glycosyltransferase [Bacillus sp. BP-3]
MKILFIATQLPPFIGSGNVRALNYINYLNRLGHELDVIAIDYPKDSIAYDENLEDVFDKEVQIHRVNPGLLYSVSYTKKLMNSIASSADSKEKVSLKKKIAGLVKRNILIPDPFLQWINPAYKKALSLIKAKGKYDCIFSMHETPSSHIVAYKIKKDYPVLPWIGYWSDPWNGDSLRKGRSRFKTFIEEKLEKNIIGKVDKMLFTTNSTKEMYINKYNLNPEIADIVYRGYDENLYCDIEEKEEKPIELQDNKLNIVHTGTIYKSLRDITPLCNALDKLKIENKNLFKKLHFIFIGQFDNPQDELRLKKFDNVTIKPLIPYKEALKYVVYADVLLLYGNKNSTQVPGKVYEYLGSKASVWTILGDEQDELSHLVHQVDKGPIVLNTEADILRAIKSLNAVDIGEVQNENWNKPADDYKWINIGKDLEKKLSVKRY